MRLIHIVSIGALTLAAAAPMGASASGDVPPAVLDGAMPNAVGPGDWIAEAESLKPALAEVMPQVIEEALPSAAESMSFPASQPLADEGKVADAYSASFTEPVDLDLLDQSRGGTEIVSNDAKLNGLVSGNSAINVSTGANTIDGAAFSNVSGVPIVIQNSGANVLIQNSTIVNLQLK